MRLIARDNEQDEAFLGKRDCCLCNDHTHVRDCKFFREGTFFFVPCLPGV